MKNYQHRSPSSSSKKTHSPLRSALFGGKEAVKKSRDRICWTLFEALIIKRTIFEFSLPRSWLDQENRYFSEILPSYNLLRPEKLSLFSSSYSSWKTWRNTRIVWNNSWFYLHSIETCTKLTLLITDEEWRSLDGLEDLQRCFMNCEYSSNLRWWACEAITAILRNCTMSWNRM